jgi:hypothetical protein
MSVCTKATICTRRRVACFAHLVREGIAMPHCSRYNAVIAPNDSLCVVWGSALGAQLQMPKPRVHINELGGLLLLLCGTVLMAQVPSLPQSRPAVEKKSAGVNHVSAAVTAWLREDDAVALRHWLVLATERNVFAESRCAAIFGDRHQRNYNPTEAFRWSRKAAEQGDARAMWVV